MTVRIAILSRMPRGPHYMPVAPDHAAQLISLADGATLGTTKYDCYGPKHARVRGLQLARKRGYVVVP